MRCERGAREHCRGVSDPDWPVQTRGDRKKAPNLLLDCLSEWVPGKQLRLADGFGWQEGSNTYVLPNGRVIGDEMVLPKALVPCVAPRCWLTLQCANLVGPFATSAALDRAKWAPRPLDPSKSAPFFCA